MAEAGPRGPQCTSAGDTTAGDDFMVRTLEHVKPVGDSENNFPGVHTPEQARDALDRHENGYAERIQALKNQIKRIQNTLNKLGVTEGTFDPGWTEYLASVLRRDGELTEDQVADGIKTLSFTERERMMLEVLAGLAQMYSELAQLETKSAEARRVRDGLGGAVTGSNVAATSE